MCKLKTLDGSPLRCDAQKRTDFVVRAAKFFAEHGMTGTARFGKDDTFVIHRNDTELHFSRVNTGDSFAFAKCEIEEAVVVETAPSQPVQPAKEPAPTATTADVTEKANEAVQLYTLLQKCMSANVDEQTVRSIVSEEVAKLGGIGKKIEVKVGNLQAQTIEGVLHDCFQTVLKCAAARMNIYLHGPAGTGKSTLAEHIAKALNLPFEWCQALQDKSEFEGFVDANGVYHETAFYRAFKNGGVFLMDELDSTAAEVLVPFNGATAQRKFCFPNGEKVEAHKDFICLAAGNTKGRGGNEAYNGRFQLDASTLDRFAFVFVDYCKEIDLASCFGDKELLGKFELLREHIAVSNLPYTVTPRGMKRYCELKAAGIAHKEAIRIALTGSWDDDDAKRLLNGIF